MYDAEWTRRLRHMLGMDSGRPGYRNHYACGGRDAIMLAMREAGLVYYAPVSFLPAGHGIWRATRAGKVAAGLLPREEDSDG